MVKEKSGCMTHKINNSLTNKLSYLIFTVSQVFYIILSYYSCLQPAKPARQIFKLIIINFQKFFVSIAESHTLTQFIRFLKVRCKGYIVSASEIICETTTLQLKRREGEIRAYFPSKICGIVDEIIYVDGEALW